MRKWAIAWLVFIGVAMAGTAWGMAPILLRSVGDSGDEYIAVDVIPEMIYEEPIEYPAEAKAKKIEGKTILAFRVETNGKASAVKMVKSSGSDLLDQAAKAGSEKFRFKPALLDGKPVMVWTNLAVNFVLDTGKVEAPRSGTFVVDENAPKLVKQVEPVYPPEAVAKKIEGKVYLKLFIDTAGKVTEARVAKSSGDKSLDDSALEAARKFLFEPARQEGRPVGVWVTLPVSFVIK